MTASRALRISSREGMPSIQAEGRWRPSADAETARRWRAASEGGEVLLLSVRYVTDSAPPAGPLQGPPAGKSSYATLATRSWTLVATCVPRVMPVCTMFSTRAPSRSAWRRDVLAGRADLALDAGAALAQLALDARAGLLDLALDAVALGAATALEALDVGLQALAAGGQLLLGLLARGHALTQALDGGHDVVAGDEEGADRDEDGALGVLLSAIDRRLGQLGAGLGGLAGGRGALARGGGLVAAASSSGLLGGGGALGRVGGALGGWRCWSARP